MDGKKSYLIGFTALFSKKGYELTFGEYSEVSLNNQYHLTAPVNSTYRSIKLDSYRLADKRPHSSIGLFGRLRRSDIVTDFEGTELETVLATVVSYLSDIHRFFSGETVLSSEGVGKFTDVSVCDKVAAINKPEAVERNIQFNAVVSESSEGDGIDLNIDITGVGLAESEKEGYTDILQMLDLLPKDTNLIVLNNVSLIQPEPEVEVMVLQGFYLLNDYDADVDSSLDAKDKDVNVVIDSLVDVKSPVDYLDTDIEAAVNTNRKESIVFLDVDGLADSSNHNMVQDLFYDFVINSRLSEKSLFILSLESVPKTLDVAGDIESQKLAVEYELSNVELYDRLVSASSNLFSENDTQEFIAFGFSNEAEVVAERWSETVNDWRHDLELKSFGAGELLSLRNDGIFENLEESVIYVGQEGEEDGLESAFSDERLVSVISQFEESDGYMNLNATVNEPEWGVNNQEKEAEIKEPSLAENDLKNLVYSSPEVTQVARLMEIMYGSKAYELIEAGIDHILREVSVGDFSASSYETILQSVVEQLKEIVNIGKTDDVSEESLSFADNIPFVFSTDIHAISKAIAEEKRRVGEIHNDEYASKDRFVIGGLEDRAEVSEFRSNLGEYVKDNVSDKVEAVFDSELLNNEWADVERELYSTINESEVSSKVVRDATAEVYGIGSSDLVLADKDLIVHEIEKSDSVYVDNVLEIIEIEGAIFEKIVDFVIDKQEKSIVDKTFDSVIHIRESAYIVDEEDDSIVFIREEAELVEKIYDSVVYKGESGFVFIQKDHDISDDLDAGLRRKRRIDVDLEVGGDGDHKRFGLEVSLADISDSDHRTTPVEIDIERGGESIKPKGVKNVDIVLDALADNKRSIVETAFTDDDKAIRKSDVIETETGILPEADRKLDTIETVVETQSEIDRKLDRIDVVTQEPEFANRHKELEVDIGEGSGGSMKTPPKKEKSRIWLIIGKIASWMLWNWKKTR